MTTVLVVLILMFALAAFGMKTGVALLIAGAVGVALTFGVDDMPIRIGGIVWDLANSSTLAAIPLFVLMGELLGASRSPRALFAWIQRISSGGRHSTSLATIALGGMVSPVVGSIGAVTAIVSRSAFGPLLKVTKDPVSTVGLVASVGALGVIFPPSVLLIVYGGLTETPILALFRAGIVPGLIQVVLFAITAILVLEWRRRRVADVPVPAVADAGPEEPRVRMGTAWQLPTAIVVIVGGLLAGWFTPVESGALGVVIVVLMLIGNREFTWTAVGRATINAVTLTCMMMFMIIGAQLIGIVLSFSGFTIQAARFVGTLDLPPAVILLIIAAVYLILGTVFEGLSLMLLTIPFILPVVVALGYDPIWFGIFMVVMVQLAEVSPPVGINIFVAQQVTGARLGGVWRGVLPYCAAISVSALILVVFPSLVELIP